VAAPSSRVRGATARQVAAGSFQNGGVVLEVFVIIVYLLRADVIRTTLHYINFFLIVLFVCLRVIGLPRLQDEPLQNSGQALSTDVD